MSPCDRRSCSLRSSLTRVLSASALPAASRSNRLSVSRRLISRSSALVSRGSARVSPRPLDSSTRTPCDAAVLVFVRGDSVCGSVTRPSVPPPRRRVSSARRARPPRFVGVEARVGRVREVLRRRPPDRRGRDAGTLVPVRAPSSSRSSSPSSSSSSVVVVVRVVALHRREYFAARLIRPRAQSGALDASGRRRDAADAILHLLGTRRLVRRPSSRAARTSRSASRSSLSRRSSRRLVGRFRRFSSTPPRLSPWPPTCAARSNARPWPSPASPSTPSPVTPTPPAPSPSRLRCRRRARTPPTSLDPPERFARAVASRERSIGTPAPTIAPFRGPRPRTPPHEALALVDVLVHGLAPGHRRRRRRVRGLVVEVQVRRALLGRRRRAERRRRSPPVARGRRSLASVRGRGAGPRLARLRLAPAAVPVVFTGYRRAVTLHHRVAPSQKSLHAEKLDALPWRWPRRPRARPRPRGAAVRSVALP